MTYLFLSRRRVCTASFSRSPTRRCILINRLQSISRGASSLYLRRGSSKPRQTEQRGDNGPDNALVITRPSCSSPSVFLSFCLLVLSRPKSATRCALWSRRFETRVKIAARAPRIISSGIASFFFCLLEAIYVYICLAATDLAGNVRLLCIKNVALYPVGF